MARKVIRLPAVEEMSGIKRTKIYDLMKAGGFPRPIKLTGKAVGWFEDDIDAWLSSRPVASQGAVA